MTSRSKGIGVRGWWSVVALGCFLTLSSVGFARTQSTGGVEPSLKITVRVYNYAHASRKVLAGAEEEATRILREAGVATVWLDCPTSPAEEENYPACPQVLGSMGVDLRIIPAAMAARLGLPKETLGHALPSTKSGSASAAWVFYHRVEKLAESGEAGTAQILGHAAAHEIGHLLLGPNRHSSKGVMRAAWGPKDLQGAAWGQLVFTPEQAVVLRAEVLARMGHQESAQISELGSAN